MARGNNPPKNLTWVICLILYLIAIIDFFGVYSFGALGSWSWIVGYAILLLAVKLRGL